MQIEGGAADHLEHVGGGGLLLQRFAQLIEQARVLDGDDRLAGEARDQLDLLVGERPHLGAVDGDRADQLVLLEHRYHENCASAGQFSHGNWPWLAVDVGALQSEIGYVSQLLRRDNAAKRMGGAEADYRIASPQRIPFRRRALHRHDPECLCVVQ